jgi:hypothetical protein
LPKDANEDLLPLYGGKIWITGDNGEKLSIPYGGIYFPNSPPFLDISMLTTVIGAAYDTEKAFDTMFVIDPYITQQGRNWS